MDEGPQAKKVKKEKDEMVYPFDKNISINKYGYAAKMKRAETLHRFLCYVVYNYEG